MVAAAASEWFWSPKIWLPANVTWESFDEMEEVDNVQKFASFSDLAYPLPICVIMLVLRALVERFIFKPLGLKLGLKERKHREPVQNPVLEKAYKTRREMGEKEVNALAFETELSPLQVIYLINMGGSMTVKLIDNNQVLIVRKFSEIGNVIV